jgi:hypothetical protein
MLETVQIELTTASENASVLLPHLCRAEGFGVARPLPFVVIVSTTPDPHLKGDKEAVTTYHPRDYWVAAVVCKADTRFQRPPPPSKIIIEGQAASTVERVLDELLLTTAKALKDMKTAALRQLSEGMMGIDGGGKIDASVYTHLVSPPGQSESAEECVEGSLDIYEEESVKPKKTVEEGKGRRTVDVEKAV